jgi:hypothetical protein
MVKREKPRRMAGKNIYARESSKLIRFRPTCDKFFSIGSHDMAQYDGRG